MSLLPSIADFGLIFEYDNLLSFSFSQGSTHNLSPLYGRISYNGISIPPNEQHLIELNSVAFSDIQTLDFDCLLWGYLILLATYFNNSVNVITPIPKRGF